VKDIFNLIGIQKVRSNENKVYVSNFCVQGDKIYDLLSDDSDYQLGLTKDEDEHFYHITNLTEKRIKRPEELEQFLTIGKR